MQDPSSAPKTQQQVKVPLSDLSRTATCCAQWLLSEDQKTSPIHSHNSLTPYICGEDAFEAIAKDIRTAEESIDIVCWGFDPAMELVRQARQWPRGDTWGDLLRLAAEGRLDAGKKVNVRVLAWYSALLDNIPVIGTNNVPGYSSVFRWFSRLRDHPFNDWADQHKYAQPDQAAQSETNWSRSQTGAGAQIVHRRLNTLSSPPLSEDQVRQRREQYNLRWFADVSNARVPGLDFRIRSGVREDVLEALAKEKASGAQGGLEMAGLEYAATHHQKTIVIDYHGKRPRAYVLGLNSVTDYWDTKEHLFNDPRRGAPFEGEDKDHSAETGWTQTSADKHSLKPYQDYACRIEGEAVCSVYRNFVQGWNAADSAGTGGGQDIGETVDHGKPPANLTAGLRPPFSNVQVLRTYPDSGERLIEKLYYQNICWARHYLYIENQYFQHAAWARELKAKRKAYLQSMSEVDRKKAPTLHVIVVTPTAERSQMVPRTHDAVAMLGHGDSVPGQDKMIRDELKQRADAEEANRRAVVPLRTVPPLSPIAKAYLEATDMRRPQDIQAELQGDGLKMRTLVASLWTFDEQWSLENTPAGRKAQAEQRDFQRRLKEWEVRRADGANARTVDLRGPLDAQGVPIRPPPDRSKELKQAAASRYREVYIHSKLMIVDDSMFTLGSANMNLRSFASDSEINIATDDAAQARRLRQQVWAQHTKGQFDGGEDGATVPKQIAKTFDKWEKQAEDNFNNKLSGFNLTCFLVKFHDDRTSRVRLA